MTDRDVLTRALQALRSGRAGALATVIAVEGSAYQREGAKLFVDGAGNVTGLISGGCLEGEVALAAGEAMADQKARVLRYDTADESIFGYGMGCPGIVDVLLEPLPKGEASALYVEWLEAVLRGDEAARAVRVGPARDGEVRQVVLGPAGKQGSLGEPALDAAAVDRAEEVKDAPSASGTQRLGPENAEVYIDVYPAQPKLVVFGAGDDAQPLVRAAQAVGMRVQVVDPRPAMATEQRFPDAKVTVLQPARYPEVSLGANCHVVVMGHQMERDEAALAHALSSAAPYVGLLSSRGRRERMLTSLQSRGALPAGTQGKLRAPIGLDIGAKSPEEIELSIVAEIVARRHGRSGGGMSGR